MLWPWYRPAATAPIRPLAWEFPYAVGSGPGKGFFLFPSEPKKKKKRVEKKIDYELVFD